MHTSFKKKYYSGDEILSLVSFLKFLSFKMLYFYFCILKLIFILSISFNKKFKMLHFYLYILKLIFISSISFNIMHYWVKI